MVGKPDIPRDNPIISGPAPERGGVNGSVILVAFYRQGKRLRDHSRSYGFDPETNQAVIVHLYPRPYAANEEAVAVIPGKDGGQSTEVSARRSEIPALLRRFGLSGEYRWSNENNKDLDDKE